MGLRGAPDLNAILDVILTNPQDKDGLRYDSASGQWINSALVAMEDVENIFTVKQTIQQGSPNLTGIIEDDTGKFTIQGQLDAIPVTNKNVLVQKYKAFRDGDVTPKDWFQWNVRIAGVGAGVDATEWFGKLMSGGSFIEFWRANLADDGISRWTLDLEQSDGKNIIFGTVNGSKIGTSNLQRLALWGAMPAIQPSHIVDADGSLSDITTKFNTLLAQMATIGEQASS